MKRGDLPATLLTDGARELFADLYGEAHLEDCRRRYLDLADGFARHFGDVEFSLFSSPGRTEIGGNHTDHNHGKVLAGSITQDCICAARKNGTGQVRLISETFGQDITVQLSSLLPDAEKSGTGALLKGILAGIQKQGFAVGGFDAYTTSTVISAAGVSSSAAFEMMVCAVVNALFNEGRMTIANYAHAGRYAENVYWEKASGLLDQMACASGGVVAMDFCDCERPAVENIDFSFDRFGCDLLIVNTGKGHADMSGVYSAVPQEMKRVAAFFGKEVLSEVPYSDFLGNIRELRGLGDRCVLRALHFYAENERVDAQVAALRAGRFGDFLDLVRASGHSSWEWLQNCYCAETPQEQPICVALALTERFLHGKEKCACRVHGGGFAGVIQVILPKEETARYTRHIEEALGGPCVYPMGIRKYGAIPLALG